MSKLNVDKIQSKNYYFYFFNWGYYYFSAGTFYYKKIVEKMGESTTSIMA